VEQASEGVAWINLAQDSVHWRVLAKMVEQLLFQFLDELTRSFSFGILHQAVS
jgi:hypothetical protein